MQKIVSDKELVSLAENHIRIEGQTRHTLLGIAPDKKRGFCALCGLVSIVHKIQSRTAEGVPVRIWRCSRGVNRFDPEINKPYRAFKKETCERCGFIPEHPCQLDVHHIDENRQNNSPENLQTLCANCHRLAHRKSLERLYY